MKEIYIGKVENIFFIIGRGIVVTCGTEEMTNLITTGDWVKFIFPDGTPFKAQIAGMEQLSPFRYSKILPPLLFKRLSKEDIPVGSLVYWLEQKSNPYSSPQRE